MACSLTMTDHPSTRVPELMAPAGDWDCARAAVENGADAIYFGLQGGFNARARAANFSPTELPDLMTYLRTRGVKGYLTLNTLVFGDELEEAERAARVAIEAGIDAVLVQDLGLLRLLGRLCPELPLHASTQMTLSSAECIREVESLGVRRVVLPRELSIDQIAAIRQQTAIELEAFVHGALCISYSGQCLASLSMGGRSANRGQCAQPCRLPYELICEGGNRRVGQAQRSPISHEEKRGNCENKCRDKKNGGAALRLTHPTSASAGNRPYPLSPHDLAAYDRLPQLIAAGVSALKIEGRLKPPEYVASVTRHYRTALDAACGAGVSPATGDSMQAGCLHHEDIAEMETTFSRGFCHGWLDGPDHRSLVSGEGSANRGVCVGQVRGVRGERILVELAGPLRRGDGVVFEGDRSQAAEQGGRVYEIFQNRRSLETEVAAGLVELAFRYGSINRAAIRLGQKVWKTDDPRAARRLRQSYSAGQKQRRVPLDLRVEASVGSPLCLVAAATTGVTCRLESSQPLPEATKHPLSSETLIKQFGRLGKTPYQLRHLEAKLDGRAMIALSELGKLRHEMLRQLDAAASRPPQRAMIEGSALAAIRALLKAEGERGREGEREKSEFKSPGLLLSPSPSLHVLCRSMNQLEAALDCGASSVIADFHQPHRYGNAVRTAHLGGASILLAAPRIHKPGESGVFEHLAEQKPDGILVRNLAGLAFCRHKGLPAVADFSLNAANDLSLQWLQSQGARRVTASYDLSRERLLELAAAVPAEWLEVVVHRHTPMFHSQHCMFCGMLSSGRNKADCGRPCDRHDVRLRDRLGVEHRLLADSQCRNTLFHAEPERLLEVVPSLQERGVRHYRVELLIENSVEQVRRTLMPCQRICGRS
jgi:U32 family peptidase